jgi:hypothetical protein
MAEPDGMCTLTARLSAETGLAIFNGLDHHARQASARAAEPKDQPGAAPAQNTLSELRADAFTYRFLGGSPESETGAFRAEIIVTIPFQSVLSNGTESAGVLPAGEREAGGLETAELEGYGPIDAATARRLAALAPTWQRLFTDCTTGQALGVGRTAYRPPKALRRYLNSRDSTRRFPGCTRRAAACEPDHTIEWQNGGTTDPGNLALLCRKHHALKSIDAWSYRQSSPSGDLEWRSPLGREYSSEPTEFCTSSHPADPPERTLKPPDHSAEPEPPPF